MFQEAILLRHSTNPIVLILLGAAVLGVLISACMPAPLGVAARATYHNPEYGFAFSYPETLNLRVYSAEHVALGQAGEDEFAALAEAGVFTAIQGAFASFEAFVIDRARATCAADGPGISLRCTDVQQLVPFETSTGLVGEVFYLAHETVDVASNQVISQSGRGPFFAFNLSANLPGVQYAVLLIRPPATLEPAEVDSELLRSVAGSVRIDRVEALSNELELMAHIWEVIDLEGSPALVIDPVIWIQDPEAPNAFRIDNPNPQLVTLAVAPDVSVVMQTLWTEPSGSFAWNSPLDFEGFRALMADNLPGAQMSYRGAVPFRLWLEDGVITKITEQYVP